MVRANPRQVTLLTLGPLSNLAAACERVPGFLGLLGGLVCLGGSVSAGGDVTAAAETNIYLNPEAARSRAGQLRGQDAGPPRHHQCGSHHVREFQPHFPGEFTGTAFLKQLLPFYFRAHHQFLGVEGIWLREVVALAAVVRSDCSACSRSGRCRSAGELTRGMTVFERRQQVSGKSNAAVALDIDPQGVVDYMTQLLR